MSLTQAEAVFAGICRRLNKPNVPPKKRPKDNDALVQVVTPAASEQRQDMLRKRSLDTSRGAIPII